MTRIEVAVQGTCVYAKLFDGPLTAGMVGAEAAFSFDAAWDGLNITAKFRGGSTVKSRALVGTNQTTVPHEVLGRGGVVLEIGVEGRNEKGTIVIPTVWAKVDMIHSGANDAAEEGRDPTPTVYDDIMAAINAGKVKGEKGDIGPRGAQGPQGEKGDKGETGPQGPQGESGVAAPVDGFFTLSLDENGNLWAYTAENGGAPPLEYDEDTGDLYYVTEQEEVA